MSLIGAVIPLLLACGIIAAVLSAVLLRGGERGLGLFSEAVHTWAGSVIGIWLGLVLVGLVLGLIAGAVVFGLVFLGASWLEPGLLMLMKLLLAAVCGLGAGIGVFWRFATLGFLRR